MTRLRLPICQAFEEATLRISISGILPLREVSAQVKKSVKYGQIAASIKEVGIIEPPVVIRDRNAPDQYHLLDGHLRIEILREQGVAEVVCLIATEDEAFTYNKRVNRLSTIQEHWMIRRAVERGVSPERLARALNVDITVIVTKLGLLDGICAEALHVLRDREFSPGVTKALRKMKPTRQIECAEMMVAGNCSTVHYAKALLAATADDMLVAERKAPRRPTEEQLGLIERETANLRARYRMIEQTYADDVLNLVVAKGYVNKLITNPEIESYLRKWHGELLPEFVALASLSSLED